MTSQKALQNEFCQKLVQSKLDLRSKHTYLAVYLLVEKSKGNKPVVMNIGLDTITKFS